MLVLITYDVSTTSREGRRRLSQVSKKCLNYGQRVQNSVFECILDATEFRRLRFELEAIIDETTDSIRYYKLGDKYKTKVEHVGAKSSYDMEGPLIL
ncbi:CRISPR-associated endonuclease Cas2 [Paenibacillus pinistramenti]|uniref:CRISPR-associated endonuclease Cas2 n=1 Tax=Paenibacillus pinistramenti TaxID=1768003 RepID=UPI0011097089|nr:CRISPR-associated endonuclease Cas2 [Paenibacillus pinistramenti]